ncbi:MAG TPA: NUDIX hydrolase [Patescibacteria group bacterium]|nr:NUDIX hydrolase [Patescibacteria group bacterium]
MDFKPWKTCKTETILENKYVRFKVDDFETGDGVAGKYWYVDNPENAVAVIGQLSEDEFVLVREYRHLCKAVSLGHIGASIEPGETPEGAAAREMEEEAGYRPGTLVRLGGQFSLPALSTEYVEVFLAQDLQPVPSHPEEYEQIEPVVMSAEEIDAAIRNGEVIDGITITAWFRVKQFLNLPVVSNVEL